MVTRVMVCGSQEEADIDLLVEAGVDAVGLITEVSQALPCNLSRAQARRLAGRVPPLVCAVLILTEERVEEVRRLVEYVRPDAVQLHGFHLPEEVATLQERLPVKIIKTLHLEGDRLVERNATGGRGRPEGADPAARAIEYLEAGAGAVLLDSYREGKVGATGETVDFRVARRLRDAVWPRPLLLAGGLHPGNVAEAVRKVSPFAVDVFTGVRSGDRLDPRKVREFARAARRCRPEGDEQVAK